MEVEREDSASGGTVGKRRPGLSLTLGRGSPSLGLSFSIWEVEAAGQISRSPQKGRLMASLEELVWLLISGQSPDLVIY